MVSVAAAAGRGRFYHGAAVKMKCRSYRSTRDSVHSYRRSGLRGASSTSAAAFVLTVAAQRWQPRSSFAFKTCEPRCSRMRVSAACSHAACVFPSRRRAAEARDGGQPAAEAQQQQKSRQPREGSCLDRLPLLLGQHDGPASARSLRYVAFSAGQKVGSSFLLVYVLAR